MVNIFISVMYKETLFRLNLRVRIRSLQIFNAILLRFSRRLRNSPRPWVKHAQRPTTSDSLEKTHQKAKSSMSLNPYPQIQPNSLYSLSCLSWFWGCFHK